MKPVLFLLTWAFYWIGDTFSKVLMFRGYDEGERWANFWYPPYNRCMLLSSDLQDLAAGEGDLWPWGSKEASEDA